MSESSGIARTERRGQNRLVQLWADVGGTFTDCIVIDDARRSSIKVLSTGVWRARIERVVNRRTLRWFNSSQHAKSDGQQIGESDRQTLMDDPPDEFWVGADAFAFHAQHGRVTLGRVTAQRASELTVDRDLPGADLEGWSLELDGGLEAPVLATHLALGIPIHDDLPSLQVRLGTTRGTNALLTRSGADTALLITRGFEDLLVIGEQDRPDLFALDISKPAPLTNTIVEVHERLDAQGKVLQSVDRDRLRRSLRDLKQRGIESLAICLMHAHVNDAHERIVCQEAEAMGFREISCSCEVAPLIKLVSRAQTTLLDAYLNPILASYLDRLWQQFGGPHRCDLRLMTSNGNLVGPPGFRGRDSVLSGPAGGVVGLAHVAAKSDAAAAIGLDMGGTSTDVSRFIGQVGRRNETRIGGVHVMAPMMDIETVAAGGGSICDFTDDGRMIVGPASAGANPGPACYGRGGPLTITDVNLLLGRIPEQFFPFPLDRSAAQFRLDEIRQRMMEHGVTRSGESIADGFLSIAVTHMAEAVRTVSTARGIDVREMALVGFGGAAGQHLCRVAETIGMRRVLDHPDAGMLSALGIGMASVGWILTHGVYRTLDETVMNDLERTVQSLRHQSIETLSREESSHQDSTTNLPVDLRFECDMRFVGTDTPIALPLDLDAHPSADDLALRFHQTHHERYGYDLPERAIELVAVRCEAKLANSTVAQGIANPQLDDLGPPIDGFSSIRLWHEGQWIQANLIPRSTLRQGDTLAAPAVVVGRFSTLIVQPGWTGKVIADGIIELVPSRAAEPTERIENERSKFRQDAEDPVLLEVVARRLQGIADAMGEVLRQTSISVNVKERRDYSCAVFRADGSLVANAPHVPVHLGAMGHTVRHLLSQFPIMHAGDCYLSNDPFSGGSHLPDVTAVTPVFCQADPRPGHPDFLIASRAHHAEIGGRTPGSMPPDATCLAEEGVVIRDYPLVRRGHEDWQTLRSLLSDGPFPSRNVDENIADIAAQRAAGAFGSAALRELVHEYSVELIDALMGRLLDVAGNAMQRWIKTLPKESMTFHDQLDDGTPIGVTLTRGERRLAIQFHTGPVHPHGFNATPAIVTAAVLYVLRCVSQTDLPLCDGVLRDVEIDIPTGLLDPPPGDDPSTSPAVVAGNVETSQRIVDVLLGALGVAAASQGTMNNVLIGDQSFGYYETIGGGSGATPHASGADAVHTHMTNTRITDAEVIESRLPVRLIRFAVRRDSGGAGRHVGGNGIVREFEFLRPLVLSLLTSRRRTAPFGLDAGQAGRPGRQWIEHDDARRQLPPTCTVNVKPGDRLIIETPGGGGWSPKPDPKL